MLTAPTLEKLHALKLAAMAAAWTEQQHQADMTALAFDERFGLLVEAEWLARENKRLTRALQEAKLKLSQACLAKNAARAEEYQTGKGRIVPRAPRTSFAHPVASG